MYLDVGNSFYLFTLYGCTYAVTRIYKVSGTAGSTIVFFMRVDDSNGMKILQCWEATAGHKC